MRKVLIVDDTPAVLTMLKRTLAPMQTEWEMVFLGSAADALTALEGATYDVLATDMVMPGMDGLQLLQEAKTRYPAMVRIGFSGEAAKGYGLRSAGLAHQFLEKPIDGHRLQSIMGRACALRASLADEQVRNVVVNLRNLPSLPAIYQELMEEIHSRDASLKKIAKIISGDLAMVSKILQLVNSAFFGLRTTVANPEQAVALLGSETIKSLVLSMQVFSQFEGTALPGCSLDALWQHGIATGTSARRIAKEERVAQSVVDDSFTAGLLHDIGLLLLAVNKPDEYKQVLLLRHEKHLPEWQAEQEVFGTTHAEVGAHLLSLWGVGEAIVEAVAFHHRPDACATTDCTPLVTVHVANAWHEQSQAADEAKSSLQPDHAFLSKTGFLDHLHQWGEACQAG